MKARKNLLLLPVMLWVVTFLLYACQKEVSQNGGNGQVPAGQQKLSVYLTDGPLDFQHVWIDIQQIEVKIDTCRSNGDDDHDGQGCDDDHDQLNSRCEIWDTLNIRPGVYDLLQLRNGADTLFASGFLLQGKIERIKLTLGNNNSLMADSITYPLHLLNNQAFIFANIHREHLDSVSNNNFNLLLDFDLAHSVKFINGAYYLRPVLKPFSQHSSGEISGKVRPVHSFGLIKAWNATDSAFALPFDEGEFKIRGLQDGVYSLFIDGRNGYRDTTITNITVQRGRETKMGTIQLNR